MTSMAMEERKRLWLWQIGPRVNLAPMAPNRQTIDLNGMVVDFQRRSKRHYNITFQTSSGPVMLTAVEANGYLRELKCDWFPSPASDEQIEEIRQHCDEII